MSQMTNCGTMWKTLVLSVILVLAVTAVAGCGSQSTSETAGTDAEAMTQELMAAVDSSKAMAETAVAMSEAAGVAAQTAEGNSEEASAAAESSLRIAETALAAAESSGVLAEGAASDAAAARVAAESAVERSELALITAQTAITMATGIDTPAVEPTTTITVTAGGVALSQPVSGDTDLVLHRAVDSMEVFNAYSTFRTAWEDDPRNVRGNGVRLALVAQDEPRTSWSLYYDESMAGEAEAIWSGWHGWSEYSLFGVAEADQEQQHGPLYAESRRLPVVDSTPFTAEGDLTILQSLSNLEDDYNVDLDRMGRLLLVDETGDETAYILILIDRQSGIGGDQLRSWCSRCYSRSCCWNCRDMRLRTPYICWRY
jgi:hypothetical protein